MFPTSPNPSDNIGSGNPGYFDSNSLTGDLNAGGTPPGIKLPYSGPTLLDALHPVDVGVAEAKANYNKQLIGTNQIMQGAAVGQTPQEVADQTAQTANQQYLSNLLQSAIAKGQIPGLSVPAPPQPIPNTVNEAIEQGAPLGGGDFQPGIANGSQVTMPGDFASNQAQFQGPGINPNTGQYDPNQDAAKTHADYQQAIRDRIKLLGSMPLGSPQAQAIQDQLQMLFKNQPPIPQMQHTAPNEGSTALSILAQLLGHGSFMPNTAMAPVMGAKNQDAQNFQQALQNYQMQMQQNGVQRQGLGEALQYQQGLDNQARQNAIAQMNYDQTQFTQRSKDGGALLAQVQKDILSQSDNGVYTPTAQANMRAKVDAIVKAYPELGHPDDVWQMTYQPDLDAEAKGAKVLNATTAASKETRLQNNDTFNQAKTGFINNVVVTNKTGTVGTDDIARYNNWATQEATDNPSWWAQNKASFPPPKLGDNWQTYLGKTKYNTQVDEYNSGAMDSQAKAAIENWQKLDTKYQNDYKEAHTDYEKEDANTKKIGENLAKAQADLAGNKPGASQAAVDQWQNQLNFAMKVRDLAWQRVQDAQNVRTQHIANMPKYTGKQTIQNRMNTSAPGGGNGGSGLTGSIGTDGSSVDVALPDGAPDPVPVAMQPARDAALAAIRPMITDDSGNPVVMNPMAVSEINALYSQNLNPQDRAKQVIAVLSKYHDDNLESDELPGLQAKLAGQAAPTGITNQQSQADRAKTITGQNTPKATAKPGVTKNGLKYRTPK